VSASLVIRRRKSSREPLALFPDTMRWCPHCGKALPPGAFSRDKKNKDGLNSHCKICRGIAKRARYQAEAPSFAARHLKRTYGIGPERFAAMVEAQGNACAICRKDMGTGRGRHVDHCHATGQVRALLCGQCNNALGNAKDDPALLRQMADYIERHGRDNV